MFISEIHSKHFQQDSKNTWQNKDFSIATRIMEDVLSHLHLFAQKYIFTCHMSSSAIFRGKLVNKVLMSQLLLLLPGDSNELCQEKGMNIAIHSLFGYIQQQILHLSGCGYTLNTPTEWQVHCTGNILTPQTRIRKKEEKRMTSYHHCLTLREQPLTLVSWFLFLIAD